MREGPILELAVEVALLASRGQPYLMALEQGVSPIFGIDTGVGLVTWKRSEGSGTVQGDLSVVGGRRSWTTQQIAEVAGTAPQHPNYQGLWQTDFPVRTSDHITLREFWPTDVWRNHHGHCDGRYPIGFAVSCSTTELKFVAMHRSDHDFSDEEVSALAAIQALLTSALEFRSRLDLAVDRLLNSPQLHGAAEGYCPSRREAEVLSLITLGWTNDRIGRHLGISERTVRKHLGAVYANARLSGRAAAAVWWQTSHSPSTRTTPDT
jgi:DNA-binding CsgD family transcriptional regulator